MCRWLFVFQFEKSHLAQYSSAFVLIMVHSATAQLKNFLNVEVIIFEHRTEIFQVPFLPLLSIVTVDYGRNLEQMMIIVEIAQVSPNQRGEELSLWSQIDHVYWPVKNQQTGVAFWWE